MAFPGVEHLVNGLLGGEDGDIHRNLVELNLTQNMVGQVLLRAKG